MTNQAQAALRLPAVFGNHMVLQQGSASVWGWAEAGKTITVSIADQKASAKAGADGAWKVTLPVLKTGGPYELSIDGDGSLLLSDVLVGDVWLGSGQSNMEFPLSREGSASTEISKADFPLIRIFTVDHQADFQTASDVRGSWKVCSPDSVKDFSAVAYYFGKDLQQTLKIPFGLIAASWGGISGEAFAPRAVLDKDPGIQAVIKAWDWDKEKALPWTEGLPYELQVSDIRLIPKGGKGAPLTISIQPGANGLVGNWNCQANTGSTATFINKGKGPKGNQSAILSGVLKGGCWITLSTPLKAQTPVFDISSYESLEFYAKGKGKYYFKFSQASISDYNYHATDSIEMTPEWKLLKFPLASFHQGDWGTKVPFTPEAVQNFIINPDIPYLPEAAGVAYNGMIAPLTNFGIKGVLWYQGETNAGRAGQYQKLLTLLINSWREAWGKTFPFIIVQLPNYMAQSSQPMDSGWAQLREAQLMTSQSVTNVGLVTTIDLGEADNIHPKNKKDVGYRASLLALEMAYQKPAAYTRPLFEKATAKGKVMTVKFSNVGAGLMTPKGAPVTGFALCGPDETYYWAEAKITGKDSVQVTCPKVEEAFGVRYAWGDNPVCNLVSKEGFPASPFRFALPPKPGYKKPTDDIPEP